MSNNSVPTNIDGGIAYADIEVEIVNKDQDGLNIGTYRTNNFPGSTGFLVNSI